MTEFDLTTFTTAIQDRSRSWESKAITWELTLGPTRDKSAAWVICESTHTAAQLTVWTSGEAELDIASLTTDASTSTHHQFADRQDLEACLDHLTKRLNTPPTP
ncbi:hypothetical protein B7C42_04317 [Nocardia cerradoensis]|uniref:Uncharacterized protein n=1 Tax=Nocardia cerradoensis TaxID=85688 RepID=A0A231H3M1_9NOCA|nr:hypothetical protein [Nocardia cerradoensis]OXR43450.1 hypothetical protein B7C42_04317 [Nocardia cerradoensis]